MQRGGLRIEKSINNSGNILNLRQIPEVKEKNYIVKLKELDGDAPKEFIKLYNYEEDSSVRAKSSSSWPSYIAKTAEKWYPHESVIEYLINRIGEVIGLNMNQILLVRIRGQIRFLSRFFLNEDEILIHGAEICGDYLEDRQLARDIAENKSSSRELFTFEFIKDSIRNVFPQCFEQLLLELVKLITFDALVGNNDRHFYNWGVIDYKKKTSKIPKFAPFYDSARGLLWNFDDENVRNHMKAHNSGAKKVIRYIENALPRISCDENTAANHFELVDSLYRLSDEYKEIIIDLSSKEKEEKVLELLKNEFKQFFIRERYELIVLILVLRFQKIRSIK